MGLQVVVQHLVIGVNKDFVTYGNRVRITSKVGDKVNKNLRPCLPNYTDSKLGIVTSSKNKFVNF